MKASLNAPGYNQCLAEKKVHKRIQTAKGNEPNSISALAAQAVFHIKPGLIIKWAPVSLLFRPDEPPSV